MKPATLPLDGSKQAFFHVVGPGHEDLSLWFSQYMTDQKVGILIEVFDHNIARGPRSLAASFPLQ